MLRDDEDVICADFLKLNEPKKRNLCLCMSAFLVQCKMDILF